MADNKFTDEKVMARCESMSRMQAVLGGKWKILILWYIATYEVQRFGELMRRIDGISQSTLTKQLRELEADGLIHREIYREIPPKVEYTLTDLGKSFVPILTDMMLWSQQWLCNASYSTKIEMCHAKDRERYLDQLLAVWRASVEATHTFLAHDDVDRIAEYVPRAILEVPRLYIAFNEHNIPIGFLGINSDVVEMLFLAPDARGKGLGKQLLILAVNECGARKLDVNEQNEQARGFYERLGFQVVGRSETDDMGEPFPILHMELASKEVKH